MKKERSFGIDCVRVMAIVCLFGLHFFFKNGFYFIPVDNFGMLTAAAARNLFFSCVPLFLMLTGYLKWRKTWNRKYIRSLIPILISFVLASLVVIAWRILYQKEEMTVSGWITEFFNFEASSYGWYVEMYIGLFLLAPFVNLIWISLKGKRQHLFLLGIMGILTVLPQTINVYKLDGENLLNLLPDYWYCFWPFTYYLIGCYIREYQPRLPKLLSLLAAVLLAYLLAMLNSVFGGKSSGYTYGYLAGYGEILVVLTAVFLFLSVYQLDCPFRIPRRLMQGIASVSLEMYLLSVIFDTPIYTWHYGLYGAESYWRIGPIMVGMVFVGSLVTGTLVHLVSRLCTKGIFSIPVFRRE